MRRSGNSLRQPARERERLRDESFITVKAALVWSVGGKEAEERGSEREGENLVREVRGCEREEYPGNEEERK